MKETEYTKSSDNQNWMDTSVISDIPFKITIIDPRPYISATRYVLESLPFIEHGSYSAPALDHLSKVMVHSFMTGIVQRRRAWINADDIDYLLHISQLREMIGVDLEPHVRDVIRDELASIRNRHASERFDQVILEILDLLTTHMNPNRFVLHEITQTRDLRTFLLEEYSDWRVIQWTKEQQAKIDDRHETL